MSKRRNRPSIPRSRSPESVPNDAIFSNQCFINSTTGFLGTNVQLTTTDGTCYEGVLAAFSSQFEIVLEYAYVKSGGESTDVLEQNNTLRRLIFRTANIVDIMIKNIDTAFANRDGAFQTDSNISKFNRNGQAVLGEKELQPWVEDCNGDELDLTLGTETGWDPQAMFKRNEELYGVRSSFDHSLTGYTLQIERSETKSFKDAEARASRIANEIEKNPKAQARLELENGDEEERFAAVVRPSDERNSPPRNADKGNKYIPPVRRQGGSYHGRLTARSTPFPAGRTPPVSAATATTAPSSSEEQPENNVNVRENTSPTAPTSNCDDNRNNNSCSPSAAPPASAPPPQQMHPRNNNNNGSRGKGYIMQGYPYSIPPRYPPAGHPQMTQHRPIAANNTPPTQQPPPPIPQHGPPPQPTPQQLSIVFQQPLPPPNHAMPPQQDAVQQQQQVALPPPPNQTVTMIHGMEHVQHMPPHGVPHVHSVVPATYVPGQRDPRDHELELRGHRNVQMRGQSPRVFQPNNKRFPAAFQGPPPPPPNRKPRSEELSDLVDFGSNLKLASEEEPEEKQGSPPLEPWGKGRSPPSNSSAEDASSALKKSTLNPNAKEFIYNPSAKPFVSRPPNTPGPSRPHTPQTPATPFGYSPGPMPTTVLMPTYVMQPAFSHQSQPPRLPMAHRPDLSSSSQVKPPPARSPLIGYSYYSKPNETHFDFQVAAATGQPLLTPAPIQRFVSPFPNPPPQPYQVRMVPGQPPVMFHPDGSPHPVQYMSPHGQPHPGGQFQQAQPQQFSVVYPMPITQTMMQYFQPQHPQPGQQSLVQVLAPNP